MAASLIGCKNIVTRWECCGNSSCNSEKKNKYRNKVVMYYKPQLLIFLHAVLLK